MSVHPEYAPKYRPLHRSGGLSLCYSRCRALIRAVTLLRDTALPVTDIGYEAGWTDLSNFARTFHRAIGCTPRDFRRSKILPAARRTGRRASG